MIFLIILAITITSILNIFLVKKIQNKTNKFCLYFSNIIFAIAFIISMLICKYTVKGANILLDKQIAKLEKSVESYYPNALSKKYSTTELKKILTSVLEKEEIENNFVIAIVYDNISELIDSALATINYVESEKDTIKIKDSITSIKEITLLELTKRISYIRKLTFLIYVAYILISIFLSIQFIKEPTKKNKGITFGEEADKTSIGMKN